MKRNAFFTLTRRVEQAAAVRAVRNGLINMIPVLIIGAFALILKTFPVPAYQSFIETFLDGFLLHLLDLVYSATFGVLSVYMTFSISRSYMKLRADTDVVTRGAVFASLLSFFILAGAYLPTFSTDNMGPKSMFMAILTGLGASALYLFFYKLLGKRKVFTLMSSGADREFNGMLTTLFPIAIVAVIFALFNLIFVCGFYKTAYKLGKPFVTYIIAAFLTVGVFEAAHHVPGLEALNAFGAEHLGLQLACLAAGMAAYAGVTALAYKKACARFEEIDL